MLDLQEQVLATDGLVLHLDSKDTNSYPGNGGNTWNDIGGNNNHFDINQCRKLNNSQYFLFNSNWL